MLVRLSLNTRGTNRPQRHNYPISNLSNSHKREGLRQGGGGGDNTRDAIMLEGDGVARQPMSTTKVGRWRLGFN